MDLKPSTDKVKSKELTKEDILWKACEKHALNTKTCFGIMKGVFLADSGFATKGAGAKHLNPGNARPGSGKYGDKDVKWTAVNNWRHYKTLSDGIYDNTAIYAQLYEGKSVEYMRIRWAGNASKNWSSTVLKHYLLNR